MSMLSHVKHFLNEDGIKKIPQWFTDTAAILKNQPEFLSLKYAFDPENEACVNLWIEFKNMEGLNQWCGSNLHMQVVNALNSYKIMPSQAVRYEIQASTQA